MPVYFLLYTALFWAPSLCIVIIFWKTLDALTRKAFLVTCSVMAALTFVMEYVYLWFNVWSFSEKTDPLLGIRLWGAPIEEFVFWFGAAFLFAALYIAYGGMKTNAGTSRGIRSR